MKLPKIFSRWLVLAVILASMATILILGFTLAVFHDIEISQNSTATAWTSANWTQTSQSDFGNGVLMFTDATSGGSVQLALGPFALRGNSSNLTWGYSPSGDSWAAYAQTPGNVVDGGEMVYDGGRYVYATRGGSTTFWRYDVIENTWTAMASVPGSTGAGCDLAYDGGDYIYALRGASTTFYRYSISGDSWTTRAVVPASIGAGGSLAYDGGNYIYAFRGGATTFYRYSISGNSWSTRTAAPGSIGAGGSLSYDGNNYIYAFRGGGATTFYRYSISGNSWSTRTAAPGGISAGGSLAYDGNNYIYAFRGGTRTTFYRYSISGNSWGTMTAAPATVAAGGTLSGMIALGAVASQVLDTAVTGSRWDGMFWDVTVPAGTAITFEARASDTAFQETDASPSWTFVGDTSPVLSGLPAGRYKQWRATLNTTDVTQSPSLNEVRVYYYGPQ